MGRLPVRVDARSVTVNQRGVPVNAGTVVLELVLVDDVWMSVDGSVTVAGVT